MPKRPLAPAFLFLAALLAAFAVWLDAAPVRADDDASDDKEIAGVEWLTDLDVARAKARETGRPLLAVFR
jgi:hypothetical protein